MSSKKRIITQFDALDSVVPFAVIAREGAF